MKRVGGIEVETPDLGPGPPRAGERGKCRLPSKRRGGPGQGLRRLKKKGGDRDHFRISGDYKRKAKIEITFRFSSG